MGLQLQGLLFATLVLSSLSSFCYYSQIELPTSDPSAEANILHGEITYPLYSGNERASSYDTSDEMGISMVSSSKVVSVLDYGAKADGRTDDSQAFGKAWKAACSSSGSVTLTIPEKRAYLLHPVTFSGSCKSNITVMIKGTIKAPSDRSVWSEKNRRHWILFQNVNGLSIGGGGTINGNGQIWWKNSCKINKSLPCKDAPTALTFYSCNNLRVENLNVKDSQQIHVSIEKCNGVIASSLTVSASGTSPNTDGIHVTRTKNIQITGCTIGTGDDCISIETGTQNMRATNIVCGPGHGISIGSLGDDNSVAQVSDVTIDTATLTGTTNGVRIKTYQGGSGYAKNIVFQDIDMKDVQNPIIIDQNYCDSAKPCTQQKSAVAVSNVLYKNIKGTSTSEVAIKFDCSETIPCRGIKLQDINLVLEGGKDAKSECKNVNYGISGTVIPPLCQ